jgi:AcrR family transcriptional regulator
MTTGKERLSRERILEAAAGVVAGEGLEALSMRRLAEGLDVWPMSLYRHFRDKEELLGALADAGAAQIVSPAAGPWRGQLRDLLGQARELFLRHPASLRPAESGPAAARVREAGLAILEQARIPGVEREAAWRALLAYTAGCAAFDSSPAEFAFGLDRLLDGIAAEHTAKSI